MLAGALLLLDLLPLYAWLLVVASSDGDAGRVAAPFAFLLVAIVGFALLGAALRALPLALTIVLALPVGLALLALAVAISPSAYGDVAGWPLDGARLTRLLADVAASSARLNAVFLLGVLVAALAWRGVALGRGLPGFDAVLSRFKVSLAAIVVAAVLAVGVPAHTVSAVAGRLAVIVPAAVFLGLLAAALSRAALNRADLRGADARTLGGERWLGMAVALSGVVVLAALVISSIITFGSLSLVVAQLGPVGDALNTAIEWLVQGFARLLYVLLGGLLDALKHASGTTAPPITPPRPPGQPQPGPGISPLPLLWIRVAQIALSLAVAALIVIVLIVLARLLTARRQRVAPGAMDEEREALDGRALLRAQLRSLLDRFGRRRRLEPEEALPNGSVRALYREVLRDAMRHKLGRTAPETPDEYGARLGGALGEAMQPTDIAAISHAYDEARYGEREAGGADRQTLQERARRVLGALKRMG